MFPIQKIGTPHRRGTTTFFSQTVHQEATSKIRAATTTRYHEPGRALSFFMWNIALHLHHPGGKPQNPHLVRWIDVPNAWQLNGWCHKSHCPTSTSTPGFECFTAGFTGGKDRPETRGFFLGDGPWQVGAKTIWHWKNPLKWKSGEAPWEFLHSLHP